MEGGLRWIETGRVRLMRGARPVRWVGCCSCIYQTPLGALSQFISAVRVSQRCNIMQRQRAELAYGSTWGKTGIQLLTHFSFSGRVVIPTISGPCRRQVSGATIELATPWRSDRQSNKSIIHSASHVQDAARKMIVTE